MNQNLNHSQQTAVSHKDGPMLVLAGPGSGKTTVITERIIHLIADCSVPPEEILVVTFSRAAAEEMRQRYTSAMKAMAQQIHCDRKEPGLSEAAQNFPALQALHSNPEGTHRGSVTIGTFHSIFYRILRDALGLSANCILSESKRYEILRTELEKYNLASDNATELITKISNGISKVKAGFYEDNADFNNPFDCLSPDLPSDIFQKIFLRYEEELRREHLMDYDDILDQCYRLLCANQSLKEYWEDQFRYILVDEFQDINFIQYRILKMLSDTNRNLFVVGDDDQAIYAFRGASPRIMKVFLKDFPEAKKVLLNINYRCRKEILNHALRLISVNKDRMDKKILPGRKADCKTSGSSQPFRIEKYRSRSEEFEQITKKLRRIAQNKDALSDTAVLFRSILDAIPLTQTLAAANIPYVMKDDRSSLFACPIAKDLIAYIKIAAGCFERKDFLRIINRPSRFISRDAFENMQAFQENDRNAVFAQLRRFYKNNRRMLQRIDRLEEDFRTLSSSPPYAAIMYIRKVMGYESYQKQNAEQNQYEQEQWSKELDLLTDSAKPFSQLRQWLQYTKEDLPQGNARPSEERNGVRILTMHGAKGLEFQTVFLPCTDRDTIPHKKAVRKVEIEEERRLFYVAMTRAKDQLVISWSETVRNKHTGPSCFLESL